MASDLLSVAVFPQPLEDPFVRWLKVSMQVTVVNGMIMMIVAMMMIVMIVVDLVRIVIEQLDQITGRSEFPP